MKFSSFGSLVSPDPAESHDNLDTAEVNHHASSNLRYFPWGKIGVTLCKRSEEVGHMRSYQIFLAAFADGYTSAIRLFDKVQRPGSSFAVLDEMTTPAMLAAYAKIDPILLGWLLDEKEREHKRDAVYSTAFRICGSICLFATIAALSFVALRR
jgi:hypothetical protein